MSETTQQYALVTGGSRGLGRAICVKLAQMGYSVLVNYQGNTAAAEETKQLVEEAGGTAELLKFDVSNKEQIDAVLSQWEATHKGEYIEVLVNNAGIRKDNVMMLMPEEDWHAVLDITLNGFYYITSRLVQKMCRKRNGRIINMSSVSGIKGLPGQTNYSAAKAAIIGATKALAQEVAPRGVTVNAIAPGFIATDMTKELNEEELKQVIPMGRFGRPEEVAAAVGFLVSEGAAYITGTVISVNGGLYT